MSHVAVIALVVIYLTARISNHLRVHASGGIILATIFMASITFKLLELTTPPKLWLFLSLALVATIMELVYFVLTSWFYLIYKDKYEDAAIGAYYDAISKYFTVCAALTIPFYLYGLWNGTF